MECTTPSLNNELWCASCMHAGVCKYTDDYTAVYEHLRNLAIKYDDAPSIIFTDFRSSDIPFVLVTPTCTMYNPVVRNED